MSDLTSLPNITLVSLDVILPESIQAAVEGLKKATLGKLDILVNNVVGSTAELPGLAYQGVYCGSKAANRLMFESMRLEFEPLGIKCLHITTSFAATAWFGNVPEFKLPDDSYYEPIAQDIKHAAQGHGYKMMSAAVYAD
ncbi:IBR finger domain protein (short-chain dehydrogenase) [Seiridium cupressi]